jgi:hypothetical protein
LIKGVFRLYLDSYYYRIFHEIFVKVRGLQVRRIFFKFFQCLLERVRSVMKKIRQRSSCLDKDRILNPNITFVLLLIILFKVRCSFQF